MIKYLWKEEWPWGGVPFLASALDEHSVREELSYAEKGGNKIVSKILKLDWTGDLPFFVIIPDEFFGVKEHNEKAESLRRGADNQ